MQGLVIEPEDLRILLVEQLEVLDADEFAGALAMSKRLRIPLERAVSERCRIPYLNILAQIAESWEVRYMNLKVRDIRRSALKLVNAEFAQLHILVPFEATNKELRVAMWDPRNKTALRDMQRSSGLTVIPHLAPDSAIRRALLLYKPEICDMLEQLAPKGEIAAEQSYTMTDSDMSPPDILQRITEYSIVTAASDIHFEPQEMEMLVRFRVDGLLSHTLSLPRQIISGLTSRIKVLSRMRIDERRLPQDGRYEAELNGFRVDMRVSSLPTHWGEKIVMRLLTKENATLDLEDLGLTVTDYQVMMRNLLRPDGLVLVTGPTGSGKSTSLYAALTRLSTERNNMVNISTVEDPVEYTFPRMNQMAINPQASLDFADGLRALLRQDPDILMVGEIRDRETAEIAVRAAMVGRLLLSSLHANDATASIPRLIDMGVEPFLLSSTLSLVIAQRLVRRICRNCRESVPSDPAVVDSLQLRPDFRRTQEALQRTGTLRKGPNPLAETHWFRGRGCEKCNQSGFSGRVGVFELFELNDQIRPLILRRADAASIRAAALEQGMKTLFEDGLTKVLLGETTLNEIFRVAI